MQSDRQQQDPGEQVTDFKVEPSELDNFSGALHSLSSQATAASNYSKKWFEISSNEARIYHFLHSMIEQIRENLEGNYNQLSKIAESSSAALTTAAQEYRKTDDATAARLDAMLPDTSK